MNICVVNWLTVLSKIPLGILAYKQKGHYVGKTMNESKQCFFLNLLKVHRIYNFELRRNGFMQSR